MIVLYSVCFSGIAKLFPPMSPTDSAVQTDVFLTTENLWVRLGSRARCSRPRSRCPFTPRSCCACGGPRGWGMLTLTQVLAAAIFTPAMMFSLMALAAAAFRAGQRDPEITQAFSDFFWLWFIGIVGTIVMQNITLAIASFTDKGDPPTFPRWYGFLNLWVAMLSLPGCVVVAMSTGPLAWDGVFSVLPAGSRP